MQDTTNTATNRRRGLILGRIWAGAPAVSWLNIALGALISVWLYWPGNPMNTVLYFIWPCRLFAAIEICSALYMVWRSRRARVVYELYYEDIFDGVCPDRGSDINRKNAWAWYRRHGSPKKILRPRACRYAREPVAHE